MQLAEFNLYIAHIRNLHCVFYRLGNVGEQLAHFVLRLHIHGVGRHLHSVLVIDRLTRLYTHQYILILRVLAHYIVYIVCRHNPKIKLPRKPYKLAVQPFLLINAVILYFYIVVFSAEYVDKLQSRLFCAVIIVCKNFL